ncbi:MAG: hypothetical protein ATN34_00595 [Epulopiscium sp. Nele67-Bin002]|nr:MAG: hypothetical protein ATN34_00595 [Epulopiscium sp. Nele67-Bin002]
MEFQNINERLVEGLKKQNIQTPMPIQVKAIDKILEGKDVVIEACTGSGKTLAYLLPIMHRMNTSVKQCQALILAPTHELVIQINEQIKLLSKNSELNITSTALIGGTNISRQVEILKKTKPNILVASTGRALELIKSKKLPIQSIKTLVIDEADHLLQKDHRSEVMQIIKAARQQAQIILCTATMTFEADDILNEAQFLNSTEQVLTNPNITHVAYVTEKRKKVDKLKTLLNKANPTRALIFINNGHEVNVVTEKLRHANFKVNCLSSNQTKQERATSLSQFRTGKANILVSSDLTARGLDIPEIIFVFNLDLPPHAPHYLHRAGRTARADRRGECISIITEGEQKIIKEYKKKLNIEIEQLEF